MARGASHSASRRRASRARSTTCSRSRWAGEPVSGVPPDESIERRPAVSGAEDVPSPRRLRWPIVKGVLQASVTAPILLTLYFVLPPLEGHLCELCLSPNARLNAGPLALGTGGAPVAV